MRLCVFVFVWIWAYAPLPPPLGFFIPLPPMHKYSLLRVFFEQLSQALADGGACSLWGNAWREDVFDPEIHVLDSVSALPATGHPHRCCQAFPAMHRYSLASHCDKSYYTGEKYPSHCAEPPTAQNNPDLFPQHTATHIGERWINIYMLTNNLSLNIMNCLNLDAATLFHLMPWEKNI